MNEHKTPTGTYHHVPERDIIGQLEKANRSAARCLKRRYRPVPRETAPVFGLHSTIMARTKAMIKERLAIQDTMTIHLYRPGPSDHQNRKFNHEIELIAKSGRLHIEYVNPEDFL